MSEFMNQARLCVRLKLRLRKCDVQVQFLSAVARQFGGKCGIVQLAGHHALPPHQYRITGAHQRALIDLGKLLQIAIALGLRPSLGDRREGVCRIAAIIQMLDRTVQGLCERTPQRIPRLRTLREIEVHLRRTLAVKGQEKCRHLLEIGIIVRRIVGGGILRPAGKGEHCQQQRKQTQPVVNFHFVTLY